MIVRPFEKKDIEPCAILHKASRRESEKGVIYDSDLDRYDLDHFQSNWQEWSTYQTSQILVAEDNGKIIGFIICGPVRTRPSFDKGVVPRYGGEIYALYVSPDQFRHGVGRQLFLNAIRVLSDKNLTSVLLWAFKKNKRACAFYESMGGEKIGKQRVELGEKSWAEESCFAWRDVRSLLK